MLSNITTSEVQRNKLMVLQVKINQLEQVNTLVDTGASCNFILKTIVEQLEAVDKLVVKPCHIMLKLADGQIICTIGIVKVTVTLEDKRIPVQMFVLDEIAYPVILGCEF
jgi:predicted aspartyl protease